jgi:hypothetical protein
MLSDSTFSGVCLPEQYIPVPSQPDRERRQRILAALGLPGNRLIVAGSRQAGLRVDEETLARYHDHLAPRLEFPFVAYYPPPSDPARASGDRCEVIELLDPRTDLCDEIDGLYCRTRKGKFLVNLPLVELTVLPPSKNLELLADYEYWFWHWRD